ncbi:hypothetical protein [Ornithinicoccus halotolerans]|uniref:hypothetical protein n=1 Tax=Ornithinicoccus halotolerans TaxID=1748220 RepID=UPI001297B7A0|nr:hypothetical protein [Ornithinicoccus halotolerans]
MLDQLAISAWLPSAAMVLSLAFMFQYASIMTTQTSPPPIIEVMVMAAQRLANMSIGGALLLLLCIVALTVLTQAFAFEAIRTLEGYWGTFRVAEWVAGKRRQRFANRREKLDTKYDSLTAQAWTTARDWLEHEQRRLQREYPEGALLTPNVLATVDARVRGEEQPSVTLSKDERAVANDLEWSRWASPELLRRRLNVDKRRRDFPEPHRALPTRLGNVLRAHEDDTGADDVETFVQRSFDDLPFSLRVEHDEQRTRLDLYCSMVFVAAFVGLLSAFRLSQLGIGHVAVTLILTLGMMLVMYRAALASARAYGLLLVTIADRLRCENEHIVPPAEKGWSLRLRLESLQRRLTGRI